MAGLRGDTSIEGRGRFDNLYIDRPSLILDVVIMLRTLREMFRLPDPAVPTRGCRRGVPSQREDSPSARSTSRWKPWRISPDLRSPSRAGHSRGVADRVARAAADTRLPAADVYPICFNAKKLDEDTLIAGAELQGTIPLWRWIGEDAATTLNY